jgi:DNA polymerase sigma
LGEQQLKVDITFDARYGFEAQNLPHMGIQCCQLIESYLKSYPNIQHVILILKKMLASKDLNSPYHGKNPNAITIF